MRLTISIASSLSLLAAASTLASDAHLSQTWKTFVDAADTGQAPPVADFSYAGYNCGESPLPNIAGPVFIVTDFGAIPNDGLSDKAAIQKTIDTAAAAGGGVVFFPPGRFDINTDGPDKGTCLSVTHSHIVLRGSGSAKGGTELFMKYHLDARDPNEMWSTPFMLQFNAPGPQEQLLSQISHTAKANSHSVEVDSSHTLKVGQIVVLKRVDKSAAAVRAALAPIAVDNTWTDLTKNGVQTIQHQEIVAVHGNQVHFREPIHHPITANGGWSLLSFSPLTECGVEDLAFVGKWTQPFVHHKSALHDGGWSILSLNRLTNSWITRCRFTNVSNCLVIKNSSHITASNLTLNGNRGHGAVSMQLSSHCLGARITDTASHWHACGVSKFSTGNVFWRIQYPADTSFEAHAQQPTHTLFDNVTGGFIDGRWGGALQNQPNHMKGLVLWNYNNLTTNNHQPYEFVKSNSVWGRIIMPHVIGFHGGTVNFVESQLTTLESPGQPVLPESLYEAQLMRRLGHSPQWLKLPNP